MFELAQPKQRSALRLRLGKELYITQRKLQWIRQGLKWAKRDNNNQYPHTCFQHQSIIRRPLRDVDMYLQDNKRVNLAIALEHLNGVVIQPGESFSFWKFVGRPTAKRGFLEGLVLKSGKVETGIGGGLCQLGNLLFWMLAHSPLTITERHRHGFDVFPDVNRNIPFGAGATLAYNYIDLRCLNSTQASFRLNLWLDDTHLQGELAIDHPLEETFEVEERNHEMKQQAWGGYSRHNEVWRLTRKAGQIVREELLAKNDAVMMYTPFLEST